MLIGYKLSPQSRQKLLERFPPKYPRVICDHITYQFGAPRDAPLPSEPEIVEVVGYINSDDGVEGLLVNIDGTVDRPDGNKYHITLSLNKDRRPVETNDFVDTADSIDPIAIDVKVYSE